MDDPFSEIEHDCGYSSSQEKHLRHRRFCGETGVDTQVSSSDESTQGEGIPVDSTGIIMCSLPETPISQSEEFLTPQENLLVNSQEQQMNLADKGADDPQKKLKSRGDVSTDLVETVDLDKNSDHRPSLEKSPAEEGLFPGKEVLGFSGESSEKQKITGEILGGAGGSACGAHADNVAERSGDSALGGNLGLLEQKFEAASLQSGGVSGDIPVDKKSAGTGFKENATKRVAPLKATEKDSEFGVRRGKEVHSNAEGGSGSNISQRQSNASKGVQERRELPASIRGLMQNAASRLRPDNSSSESQSLPSLMDTMVRLAGEHNATTDLGDVDILEIAKKRGMKFPQPRWWKDDEF